MKSLTLLQARDHFQYACRSAILICACFTFGLLIGAFVSDREVEP